MPVMSKVSWTAGMHIKDLYSVVVTERRAECRDFYVRWFGFHVVFEASWFVYLAASGDHPFGLAFMAADHPSRPPGRDAFNGKGLLLTLQVEDATAEFERLKGGGLAVYDPSGAWVDVIQQIDPAPGFWGKYR